MNRLELRDLAKKELFRNGHTKFRDDIMDSWADEAMDWLQTIRPDYWFWRTVTNVTVLGGSDEMVLPADLSVLISMWNQTDSREVTMIELDDLRTIFKTLPTNGVPESFYQKGSRIIGGIDQRVVGMFRTPSVDTDFELVYYRRPLRFVDDTSPPDLPEQFHWFVKNFMVNRGAMFIEDDALMQTSWALVSNIRERIDKNHERSIKRRNWVGQRRSQKIIRTLRRRQGFFESRFP